MEKIYRIFSVLFIFTFLSYTQASESLVLAVWSDTHFGAYDYSDKTRLQIIEQINTLGSKNPPAEIAERLTKSPADLLVHCGDITEKGLASQWHDPNIADQRSYISTISHLSSSIDTIAALGNHDCRKKSDIRKPFADIYGGTYYSRNVKGVHIVVLDPYPELNSAAPRLDARQLDWLRADLEVIGKTVPLLFIMHVLPCSEGNIDRTSRLDEESSEALYKVISGRNILAFFHGHWHNRSLRKWKEIDIIAPAGFGYYREGCKKCAPIIGVVRIDKQSMKIYGFNWEKDKFEEEIFFTKSFNE